MAGRAIRSMMPTAVLMAAFLLMSGCAGGGLDAGEALAAAAQAAREAGSAHVRMNVTVTPPEAEEAMGLNIQGDTWMDMDAGMLEARLTVMGMEVSLRYLEETAYFQLGGNWYFLSGDILNGAGGDAVAAAADVLNSFPEIISSNLEVREVGEESIGESACVRIEVLPDLKAIAALAPVRELAYELDMDGGELAAYLEGADVVVEVWVQKDDPTIRRAYLAASVELPSLGDIINIPLLPERARVEITMDFTKYGVEVEFQPPADAAPFKSL